MSRLWFAECRARVVRSRGSRVLVAVRRLRHGIPRLVSPDPFASVRVRDSRMGHLCFSALSRDRDSRDALSRTSPRALSPFGTCAPPRVTRDPTPTRGIQSDLTTQTTKCGIAASERTIGTFPVSHLETGMPLWLTLWLQTQSLARFSLALCSRSHTTLVCFRRTKFL